MNACISHFMSFFKLKKSINKGTKVQMDHMQNQSDHQSSSKIGASFSMRPVPYWLCQYPKWLTRSKGSRCLEIVTWTLYDGILLNMGAQFVLCWTLSFWYASNPYFCVFQLSSIPTLSGFFYSYSRHIPPYNRAMVYLTACVIHITL